MTGLKLSQPCDSFRDFGCGCHYCHDCGWPQSVHLHQPVSHPTPPSSEALGNQRGASELPPLGEYAEQTRRKVFSHGGVSFVGDMENIRRVYLRMDALEARLAAVPAHPKAKIASLLEEAARIFVDLTPSDGQPTRIRDAYRNWLTRYRATQGPQETKAAEKEGE